MTNNIDGISVITIVLNQVDLIERTLKSVLEQRDVAYEYIIVDGGSTDGTLEILNSYRKHFAHVISEEDGGIYQAINKGLSLAKYSLIGLIHCGDVYTPGALYEVYKAFSLTNADIVYGDIQFKQTIEEECILKTLVADHSRLKSRMSIYHPSTFIKKSVYKALGGYSLAYRSVSDYDLILKVFLEGRHFFHVPKVLAVFSEGGLSGKNVILSFKENYHVRMRHLGPRSALLYLVNAYLVHLFYSIRRCTIILFIGKRNFDRLRVRFYAVKNKYQ